MLAGLIVIFVVWGLLGVVVGGLYGTNNGFLQIIAAALTLFYIITCLRALSPFDWTLFVGIPSFIAGTVAGLSFHQRKQEEKS